MSDIAGLKYKYCKNKNGILQFDQQVANVDGEEVHGHRGRHLQIVRQPNHGLATT